MLRMFGQTKEPVTLITVAVSFTGKTKGGEYANNVEFEPSSDTNDYAFDYEIICRKIENIKKTCTDLEITIKLSGRLNGEALNETFHDLDTYRQYLENASLVSKASLRC